jgi:hypothetical protein
MGGTDFYSARSACSKKRYSVGSTTSVRSVLEDKAPDDHCGRRLLHFCTGSRRARHRNKPQRSYKGRHEYWPKPSKRALDHRLLKGCPLAPELVHIGDYDGAI